MALLRRTRQQTSNDEFETLRTENERLRQLVAQRASVQSSQTGYLFKYRPQAMSSLWANPWENRYFLIQGQTLAYYKSETDLAFPPRGKIELPGTQVVVEGIKRRKYYTFNIQDKSGFVLIRLSTERHSEMLAWLDALEQAGSLQRNEDDSGRFSTRGRSPSPRSSPGTSAISDSTQGRAPSPDRMSEVDSQHTASGHLLQRKNSGYTSDQSDVGGRIQPKYTGHGKGGKSTHVGCAVVHEGPKYSLLSSERIEVSNQSGMVTLMFLIVAATNFRLILENMLKYGLLFNPMTFFKAALTPSGNLWLLLCWPLMGLNCLFALSIERFAAYLLEKAEYGSPAKVKGSSSRRHSGSSRFSSRNKDSKAQHRATEALIFLLNLINTSCEMLLPCIAIYNAPEAEPLPSFALTMVCIILWMKLISFAHVNYDIRQARKSSAHYRLGERGSKVIPKGVEHAYNYPENLTLGNISYFLVAPTLCYQLSYPRSPRFRMRWMMRRILMLCSSLGMMLFIIEQYIEPTIDNSLRPLRELDWLRMTERVLKLSIPTLYFWLAMFYTLFDLWLNIIAEFTRFGDREFYKDWWNATTVGEYWRLWNMPVHKWMLRHVYFPCISIGIPKFVSGFIVFFISAVFHELLVGVPLQMVRWWAFFGILMQVPLMWLTEHLKRKFKRDRVGNIIFWVSFCFLGQPLAEILYFHDWRKQHNV